MDSSFRDPALEEFDTTRLLANAREQAAKRRYDDFMIVDVDAHHYENESHTEITDFIEDPVFRNEARVQGWGRRGVADADANYQNLGGRITRIRHRAKEQTPAGENRDITLTLRWMDAMGVDVICLFPTPMLSLGMSPRPDSEVQLARGYNRWLCEKVLAHEPRIRSMLYLPFNHPEGSIKMVEDFADKKGVIGFMVTAPRQRGVFDNAYMKLYAMLEERGLPLAFHGGFSWQEQSFQLANRFIVVHALGFTFFNMLHLSNWIMNALPERFPKLKVIWIESGLAWVPFLMQRLDNEYMMRTSEAPGLKRKPSDYMREMFFTTQPMEGVENRKALEVSLEMMKAETQLLYSSDYPHWDMDLPSTIYDLPFLSEQARRNILGENARRLFKLDPVLSPAKLLRRAQRTAAQ
ncbi:MAG TPA: amidohydrolase family protein [Stellaceae bacterium]|nr:amidohydrolase family protein [Stellaceae bacterium]